ncbi:MAG: transposase, partial [Myxococcales bacterium]
MTDEGGMPRAARQVLEGVPHHIVLRGNNRRRLFSYPRDYLFFLALMSGQLTRSNMSAHALCLMPNHVHLLATPFREDALGTFVKRVAQRYAQVRNKRYQTTGKLFEQRYYSRPMKSESHLAIATAYVDLNPVRARLVDDGNEYEWSTHRIHCGLSCPAPGGPGVGFRRNPLPGWDRCQRVPAALARSRLSRRTDRRTSDSER